MFGIHPNFLQELIIWGSIFTVAFILEVSIGAFYAHTFAAGTLVTLILTLFRVDFSVQVYTLLALLMLMHIRLFFRYQKRTKNRPHPEALILVDSIQSISAYNKDTNTYSLDAGGYRWEVICTQDIKLKTEVIVKAIKGSRLVIIKK